MVNYSKSKIYKIEPIVDHDVNDVYYGATTKHYLSSRWGNHTVDYRANKEIQTTVKLLFDKYGITNCHIVLVELYPCNSKDELSSKEGEYIRNNPCVNKQISGRTKQEYSKMYISIPENIERKLFLQKQRRANLSDEEKEKNRIRGNELQKIRRKKKKEAKKM